MCPTDQLYRYFKSFHKNHKLLGKISLFADCEHIPPLHQLLFEVAVGMFQKSIFCPIIYHSTFTLEMDAMIGLPLEENYRTIRMLPATTGLEDLQGLLFDNGWRLIAAVLSSNSLIRQGFYKEIGMVSFRLTSKNICAHVDKFSPTCPGRFFAFFLILSIAYRMV